MYSGCYTGSELPPKALKRLLKNERHSVAKIISKMKKSSDQSVQEKGLRADQKIKVIWFTKIFLFVKVLIYFFQISIKMNQNEQYRMNSLLSCKMKLTGFPKKWRRKTPLYILLNPLLATIAHQPKKVQNRQMYILLLPLKTGKDLHQSQILHYCLKDLF